MFPARRYIVDPTSGDQAASSPKDLANELGAGLVDSVQEAVGKGQGQIKVRAHTPSYVSVSAKSCGLYSYCSSVRGVWFTFRRF